MSTPTLIKIEGRYRDGEGERMCDVMLFLWRKGDEGPMSARALAEDDPDYEPLLLEEFVSDKIEEFVKNFAMNRVELRQKLRDLLADQGFVRLFESLPAEYERETGNDSWELEDTEVGRWTVELFQLPL